MKLPNPVREIRTINELLSGADAAARRLGDASPGPEHLLLAALDMDDGTARRAFVRAGADPGAFEAAVAAQHDAALRAIGVEPVALDLQRFDATQPVTDTPARGSVVRRRVARAGGLTRFPVGPPEPSPGTLAPARPARRTSEGVL